MCWKHYGLMAVSAALGLFGCADDNGSTQPVGCAALECNDALGCACFEAEEKILIGTALSQSGSLDFLGVELAQGAQIAVDERGTVAGHEVSLVHEDSQCTPEGGAAAAQALVDNYDDKVVAVVGTVCSGAGAAAAPIVTQAGLVMISPTNSAPSLTNPDTHEAGYLRTSWNDVNQATAIAQFARESLKVTTAAVITTVDVYSSQLANRFVTEFEGLGGTAIATVVVSEDATDVAGALTSIKDEGTPELLFFPVFMPLGGVIIEGVRADAAFENTEIAASDGLFASALAKELGDGAEGMYFSNPDLAFSGEVYEAVATAYERANVPDATGYYPLSYDGALMILEALQDVVVRGSDGAVSVGRQALRDALYATSNLRGASGTLTCDSNGDCGAVEISLMKMEGGEVVPAGL